MKNSTTFLDITPERMQDIQKGAMELAYLVADTLPYGSLKKVYHHLSDFDKDILRMLRKGSEKIGETTAQDLTDAIVAESQKAPITMALAKQDMVTRLDTLSYRRLKRMRELFMDTDIRACYMDEFKKRKGHFEILAKGKEGEKDVQKLDKKIKDKTKEKHQRLLEKFFQGTQLSELDESNINAEIETLEEDIIALKAQKDQLLQNQDVALVDRLTELKAMKGKNGYVMTKSREDLFNEAVEQFLAGNHILLKGDTGSGKTALAGEVISYIEELSEGKISILKVDGKKLEQEARDPEFLRRQEIMVFSGGPHTTNSDMIGKQTLEGNIATGFQYGTLLKAFMEGRVCLIDEIDTIPPEVLMRVKQLFEKKSMSMYAPQENGGERKALLQTKIIATANIKSEKYTYQNQLPPQLENLFVTIEVPYLPKEEIYDFALVELMNREGLITGVGKEEFDSEEKSIIPRLISAIDRIEELFRGEEEEVNNKRHSLKNAIFTMRNLIPIFRNYRGKNLYGWIKSAIVSFIAGANDKSDRLTLARVFNAKGFLGQDDITSYRHMGGTLSLDKVLKLSVNELEAVFTIPLSDFPQSKVPFIDAYEVAKLDPYKIRQMTVDALIKKEQETLTTILQQLIGSVEEKYDPLIEILDIILEKSDQPTRISSEEIQMIMKKLYEIYDEEDVLLMDICNQFSQLGGEWEQSIQKKQEEEAEKKKEEARQKFKKEQQQVTEEEQKLEEKRQQLAKEKEELEKEEQQLGEKKGTLKNIQEEQEAKEKELRVKSGALQLEEEGLEQKKQQLEQKKETLNTEIENLGEEINSLQLKVNETKTERKEIFELVEKYSTLKNQKEKLQQKIAQLEQDATSLEETKKSKEAENSLKKKLLSKAGMNERDKQNMQTILEKTYLTVEELENLYKTVEFGDKDGEHYCSIDGIRFSTQRLVPQDIKWSQLTKYIDGVMKENNLVPGIWKCHYGSSIKGYYFMPKMYLEECKKQGKKAVYKEHIEKALSVLPSTHKGEILAILLGGDPTGYMVNGERHSEGRYGKLGYIDSSNTDIPCSFTWSIINEVGTEPYINGGYLSDHMVGGKVLADDYAFPYTYLVE